MAGAKKIDPVLAIEPKNDITQLNVDEMILDLSQAYTLDELQDIYTKHYRICADARDMSAMKALIAAKDKVKAEIQNRQGNESGDTE
jgi:hypothetical protein